MKLPYALQQAKVVFLTGAGASAPLGLPTTAKFLSDFAAQGVRQRLPNADAPFYDFIVDRLHVSNGPDIEYVLARLERDASWADAAASDPLFLRSSVSQFQGTLAAAEGHPLVIDGVMKALGGDLQQALMWFKSANDRLAGVIYDEVIDRYGQVDEKQAVALYRDLLGHFADFFATEFDCGLTIPFFTLNYDIAVEQAAGGLGLEVEDGFVRSTVGRRWSAESYTEYVEKPGCPTVMLIKLHGSVRLARNGVGQLVEVPPGLDRDPSPNRHVVLYPSLTPKPLSEDPFRTNYALLRGCLRHAVLLVVIGCSLRDVELNNLLRDCMEDNDRLHLLAVGPEADYKDIAERIGCSSSRVGGAQGCFAIEDPGIVDAGQGQMINMLRRWMAATANEGPHQFGSNVIFSKS